MTSLFDFLTFVCHDVQTQMVLLIVLILSQLDFVIGTIVGPKNQEEIAKGFVGYNGT